MKRRIILFGCGFVIVLLALLVMFAKRPQPAPLPSPNGYDDFLSVASFYVPNSGNWRTQDVATLRAALAPNSNALETIHAALKKEWAVPIAYGTNFLAAMMPKLVPIKDLAHLLCAEGRLAELEHRTNEALQAYADCIQLGHKSMRGGLILHGLVGIACSTIGTRAVQTVWPRADDSSLQAFLNRLSEITPTNESVEEVIRQDRDWSRASYGLKYVWESVVDRSTFVALEESFRFRYARTEAEMRLLRTDVAIELFRRKNLRHPNTLSELVPQYLEAVPIDPFSDQPMVYRPSTNSYLLYSVGPDKKDDRGTPLSFRKIINAGTSKVEAGDILSTPP